MKEKKIKKRVDINDEYKWNLSLMYDDESRWDDDFKLVERMALDFKIYENKLGENSSTLLSAFIDKDNL